MAKSLNKVQIIGNLVKDPVTNTTTSGANVATFVVATDRSWTTSTGEKREQSEFHRVVAWDKLAEIVQKILSKGRRVYVEGRLSTRKYTATDGVERYSTEIIANEMIALDGRKDVENGAVVEKEEKEDLPF